MPDQNDKSNSTAGSQPAKPPSTEEQIAQEEQKANQELEEQKSKEQAEGQAPSGSAPETPKTEEKAEEKEEEEEELDLSQFSAKGQKRIQKLVEKAKRADELEKEVKTLRESHVETPKPPEWMAPKKPSDGEREKPKGNLPWNEPSQEGQEEERVLTQDEFKEEVRKVVQEENENSGIFEQFNKDVGNVEEKYPQFRVPTDDNPNPDFDQELVKYASDLYMKLFRTDKRLRLLTFVDQLMALRDKGLEQGKRESASALGKQEAEQAISPSGAPGQKGGSLEDSIKNVQSLEELHELEKSLPHADK